MRLDLLKGLMGRYGYTQEKLAEKLNLHRNTVQNKLNGNCNFTDVEILTICKEFNVEPNYLLKED